ncbi:N-acetylmannosamine-6-phosphate 2-epimerase [Lachnoclostridium phytofermentans]|uniref:Putative N-acetylmannosamine-6-phosphate 2-epimerase n=1 Tax=Lachnoclostridium phytofermentans (strain ATCC 700394 / DSM 18823 / ISDg) TaxID=357809 RepID=A9KIQ1_LACP7|nr:N-acetylmannosamine-6-phosphate 2-epimerase [Lachnoclostridium phytofermentans]ABX43914.1 N-acylglucosamine-6-phosphate 2-epimerase [Lachnoclostridium phytofermentans ISDg]
MNQNKEILDQIRGGLVVSCQALSTEPLYSSYIMSRMAYAAQLGGAVGIRANTPEDIIEIKKTVNLPVIGLYKQVFEDSDVYITPTIEAVRDIVAANAEIIAIDATNRLRPHGISLDDFFKEVREMYPNQLFMADCATYEEAIHAYEIGFDLVGTTLCGYTEQTKGVAIPNFELLQKLANYSKIPVIAEGGIWSPEQLKQALECGVHAAVVGTAITRPMDITKRYVQAIQK